MKFCFRTKPPHNTVNPNLEDMIEGLNESELVRYLGSIKAGTRMHLIIRPRPGFNVEAMRNYFHGPMLTWICDQVRAIGIPCSREGMKDELKKRFIGVDKDGKVLSLADTLEVIVEGDARSPEKKYGDFLTEIRQWCRDVLNGEPPLPDQTDLGEEINECAVPTK